MIRIIANIYCQNINMLVFLNMAGYVLFKPFGGVEKIVLAKISEEIKPRRLRVDPLTLEVLLGMGLEIKELCSTFSFWKTQL